MGDYLMLKINLIAMGDIKEKYFKEAINEYLKRLTRFADVKIIELKENAPKNISVGEISNCLKKDAEEIKKHIKGYPVCLDIKGKELSSEDMAKKLQSITLSSSEISFIIGASNGIADEIKNLCKERISFSLMTFPHQLMRVIFLEQLYRSFTILNNIAYHK